MGTKRNRKNLFWRLVNFFYFRVLLPLTLFAYTLFRYLRRNYALVRNKNAGSEQSFPEASNWPKLLQNFSNAETNACYYLKIPRATDFNFAHAVGIQTKDSEATKEWQSSLRNNFNFFEQAGFSTALFCHGTFVGHDPLSAMQALKALVPRLPRALEVSLGRLVSSQSDKLLGDKGNFLQEHISLYEKTVGWTGRMAYFRWSSANHHAARLAAALELAEYFEIRGMSALKNSESWINKSGTVLFGHSHGGQVFALLSRLIAEAKAKKSPVLLNALRNTPLWEKVNLPVLKNLHSKKMLFVTLGCPNRYRWTLSNRKSLLSIVNYHPTQRTNNNTTPRGILSTTLTTKQLLEGFLHTRDGDYVQLWGNSGSDFPATTHWERTLNLQLDEVLGQGQSMKKLLQLGLQGRICEQGCTVLADFQDSSSLAPNFIASGFGHAAYTRFESFLPITNITRDFLTHSLQPYCTPGMLPLTR